MKLDDHLKAVRDNRSLAPVSRFDDKLEALTQALVLRNLGLTYVDIATVMRVYHGIDRSYYTWRNNLRKLGAPPVNRGNPLTNPPRHLGRPKRPVNPVFARRLRSCRRRAEMSQSELARRVGYAHYSTVRSWESSVAMPSEKTLDAIAAVFGVSVEYLSGSEVTADAS